MLPSAQCRSTDVILLTNSFRHPLSDEDADAIYVDDNTRIQILDTMLDLPRADKEQCGAFIVRWFLSFLTLVVHLSFLRYSATSGYWSFGQTAWIPSSHSAATLMATSSSSFGLSVSR